MANIKKRSKLLPLALLGAAGGAVVALRRRGGNTLQQAAGAAGDLAERAKDAVTGDSPAEEAPRYAAPAEAGAQPPTEPGGAPSDNPQATVARTTVTDEPDDDSLATRVHDLPADVAAPDVSGDDPSVQDAEAAAAADAGSIGDHTGGPKP